MFYYLILLNVKVIFTKQLYLMSSMIKYTNEIYKYDKLNIFGMNSFNINQNNHFAFYHCDNTIPPTVQFIGYISFSYCELVTKFIISSSLTK